MVDIIITLDINLRCQIVELLEEISNYIQEQRSLAKEKLRNPRFST